MRWRHRTHAAEPGTSTNIVSTPEPDHAGQRGSQDRGRRANVPFITGSSPTPAAAAPPTNPFQTIERKDVGITLKHQAADRRERHRHPHDDLPGAEQRQGGRGTLHQCQRPVDHQQELDRNHHGGRRRPDHRARRPDRRTEYIESKSKVPLLGDIPDGGATCSSSESRERKKRTNLMVFLRPVVMRDRPAATAVSQQRYEELRQQQRPASRLQNPVLPINARRCCRRCRPRAGRCRRFRCSRPPPRHPELTPHHGRPPPPALYALPRPTPCCSRTTAARWCCMGLRAHALVGAGRGDGRTLRGGAP
jgi:general secretion pathway protein D